MHDELAKSQLITKAVTEHSARIELGVDALESELNSRLASLPVAQDYLSICKKLSALSGEASGFLAEIHVGRLADRGSTSPPETVFYFLRLHDLGNSPAPGFAETYRAAWSQWVDDMAKQGRLAPALEVLALVVTTAPEYAPKSPQKLFENTYATLEKSVAMSAVERLEKALATIQSALGRLPNREGWERAGSKATARLKLARARAMEPSEKTTELAMQALRVEPRLSVQVNAFLVAAAPRLALPHAKSHDYVQALAVFQKTLALTQVAKGKSGPELDAQAATFRSRLVAHATQDAAREVSSRRFAESRNILERVAQIAVVAAEKRQISEALKDYYVGYVDDLLEQGSERSLPLSREAPFRRTGKSSGSLTGLSTCYLRLERELGEIETTRSRLGAAKILQLLGTSVKEMITDQGASACQELLGEIEETWSRQLEGRKNPAEGFDVALQIARLNRRVGPEAKAQAAKVLWHDLDKHLQKREWSVVEVCIDTYFDRCPEVQRPAGFKAGYVEYLEQLSRTGQQEKLGRHIALFEVAYPGANINLTSHPEATPGTAGISAPPRNGPAWKEPTGLWKETNPRGSPEAAAASGKRVAGPGVTGFLLALVSIATVSALVGITLKSGILAFHWYAAGAFVVGITLGFFLARPPGTQAETTAGHATAAAQSKITARRDSGL